MKISIITVTLNAATFLENCITSVTAQDYPDLEYILIDGNSSDSTVQIINRHKSSINHFISEHDENQYDALNKGIALATGDVIGILNADDYLATFDAVSSIATFFEKNKYDIVYGDLDYVKRDYSGKIIRKWRSVPFKRHLFNLGWMPAHPTWYAKKELFQRLGHYKTGYGIAADYELMLRFMLAPGVKCGHLKKVLVKMRAGGVSNNSFKNRLKALRLDYRAMKDNGLFFPQFAALSKRLAKIPQFVLFDKSEE